MDRFNPARLDLARRRRGYTKGKLASKAELSSRSLLSYERGEATPTADTIEKLSEALGFPVEFFLRADTHEPTVEMVSFRARSSMSARQRDQAISAAALAIEYVAWLEKHFTLPRPDVPSLPEAPPEEAAERVRAEWGLGERRVPNLVHLLESRGVRVFSLSEEYSEVDAFSFWLDGTPYVFLNTAKSAERSRMDAAHELGHLVMHLYASDEGRQYEPEATAFAGAFLMPERSLKADAPRVPSVAQIVKAKKRWNVSAMALVQRMRAVELLTEWQARSLFVEMSKRGYRTREPSEMPRETSQVLAKITRSLRHDGMTLPYIAAELAVPVDELYKLVFGLVIAEAPEGAQASVSPAPREPPRLHLVG